MYVIYDEDIVIGIVENKICENCVLLPEEFIDYDLDKLRFDGENIIDISNLNTFYICEYGEKHIYQDENNTRQELNCKWNDIIEQDENGIWKVITIDKMKEEKMHQVYELRKEKENNGIIVDDFFVDTSETGRLNLSNTINAFDWGLLPQDAQIEWKLAIGDFRKVGYNQLKIFAGYVAQYIEGLFQCEKVHDENIKNLTTIEEVESYDITQGWISNVFITS